MEIDIININFKIMSELYWLGVLGSLHEFGVVVAILSGLVLLFVSIFVTIPRIDNEYDFSKEKKAIKYSLVSFFISLLVCMFIPSTKSLLIIYGVGGTIDYVKENKVANKIPDKCIKALDKYLDDALKEDKDKE